MQSTYDSGVSMRLGFAVLAALVLSFVLVYVAKFRFVVNAGIGR